MEKKQAIEIDLDRRDVLPDWMYEDEDTLARLAHAKFCLQHQGHDPKGVDFPVLPHLEVLSAIVMEADCRLKWTERDPQKRITVNRKVSTERAAEALALFLIRLVEGFHFEDIPDEGTGMDFILYRKAENGVETRVFRFFDDVLEDEESEQIGMEVSGIQNPTSSNSLRRRVDTKIKRLDESKKKVNYPIYVIVAEFETPSALTYVYMPNQKPKS